MRYEVDFLHQIDVIKDKKLDLAFFEWVLSGPAGYNQIISKLQTSNLSKVCLAVETFFCVWNDGWHPLEQQVVILGEILGVCVRHAYPILQLESMFQLNYFLKQNWNFILYLILKVSLLTNHSKRFVCSRNQSIFCHISGTNSKENRLLCLNVQYFYCNHSK